MSIVSKIQSSLCALPSSCLNSQQCYKVEVSAALFVISFEWEQRSASTKLQTACVVIILMWLLNRVQHVCRGRAGHIVNRCGTCRTTDKLLSSDSKYTHVWPVIRHPQTNLWKHLRSVSMIFTLHSELQHQAHFSLIWTPPTRTRVKRGNAPLYPDKTSNGKGPSNDNFSARRHRNCIVCTAVQGEDVTRNIDVSLALQTGRLVIFLLVSTSQLSPRVLHPIR